MPYVPPSGNVIGALIAANNLSDVANVGTSRTNLSVLSATQIAAAYQPLSAILTEWAGIDPSANGASLVSAADYSAMRTLLGLVIGTNVQAYDADLATIAGQVNTAYGMGLLTLADAAALTGALNAGTTALQGANRLATDAEFIAQSANNRVLTPANLAARPAFRVSKNGVDQTGISSATPTLITWSTEDFDIGSYFASNVWTPPAGRVFLHCNAQMSGTISADADVYVRIHKNGSLLKVGTPISAVKANSNFSEAIVIDNANGTDTYSAYALITTSSGNGAVVGTINNTFFEGFML